MLERKTDARDRAVNAWKRDADNCGGVLKNKGIPGPKYGDFVMD